MFMARGKDGGAPKKGKKNRKLGANQKYCDFYRAAGLQEKNRERRILRHLKKYPADKQALEALDEG
jgi:hypothetical protein